MGYVLQRLVFSQQKDQRKSDKVGFGLRFRCFTRNKPDRSNVGCSSRASEGQAKQGGALRRRGLVPPCSCPNTAPCSRSLPLSFSCPALGNHRWSPACSPRPCLEMENLQFAQFRQPQSVLVQTVRWILTAQLLGWAVRRFGCRSERFGHPCSALLIS